MNDAKRIGIVLERLRSAREAMGNDLDLDIVLAKRVGVDSSQVGRWKKGAAPRMEHLAKLSLVLQRPWSWLMGVDGEPVYREMLQLEIREVYGEEAGDVLDAIARAPADSRARLVGKVLGWLERELVKDPDPAPSAPPVPASVPGSPKTH